MRNAWRPLEEALEASYGRSEGLRQLAEVNPCVVLEGHSTVDLVDIEDPPHLLCHRRVTRVVLGWSVGRAQQATTKARKVENLSIVEAFGTVACGAEEGCCNHDRKYAAVLASDQPATWPPFPIGRASGRNTVASGRTVCLWE